MLDQWRADVRLGCRRLARTKGSTSVAVGTLALGLSGATVMFALVQATLLRPLPVHEQDRVVVAWKALPASGFTHYPFGDTEIEEVGRESRLFDNVAGVTRHGAIRQVMTVDGVSTYVDSTTVTGTFFDVLGVDAVLGRTITATDDHDGAAPVIVTSYGFWQQRYGGSPDVIGRRLTLGDLSYAVVGVLPPGFDYPVGAELWRTTRSVPSTSAFGDAGRREIDLIGRLQSGVTIEQATDELAGLTRRLERTAPAGVPQGLVPVVRSLEEVVVGDIRATMLALFVAVGVVLLIACANVANLLLVRGETRRPELAVRRALGASPIHVVRQLFVESLLLGLAAGVAGLLVAWWSLPALLALATDRLPRVEVVQLDASVILFAVGLIVITTVLAGLAPALSIWADVSSRLGERGVAGAVSRRGRGALVVAQVALAVVVVAAAAVVTSGLVQLEGTELGMSDDRLVFVELSVPPSKYPDAIRRAQFFDTRCWNWRRPPGLRQ